MERKGASLHVTHSKASNILCLKMKDGTCIVMMQINLINSSFVLIVKCNLYYSVPRYH